MCVSNFDAFCRNFVNAKQMLSQNEKYYRSLHDLFSNLRKSPEISETDLINSCFNSFFSLHSLTVTHQHPESAQPEDTEGLRRVDELRVPAVPEAARQNEPFCSPAQMDELNKNVQTLIGLILPIRLISDLDSMKAMLQNIAIQTSKQNGNIW